MLCCWATASAATVPQRHRNMRGAVAAPGYLAVPQCGTMWAAEAHADSCRGAIMALLRFRLSAAAARVAPEMNI